MSVVSFLKLRNCRANVPLEEITAMGIVILLFCASTALTHGMLSLSERSRNNDDLTETALAAVAILTSHPYLTYNGITGLLDVHRLYDLKNDSLPELTGIPHDHGASVTVTDVNPSERISQIFLMHDTEEPVDSTSCETAVCDEPVNIRLNEFEVHPGLLRLTLWC